VHLSSCGAHLPAGTGFITGSYRVEQILNSIPGIRLTRANDAVNKGIPTVQFVAETLCISPGYLSGLLKSLTGESTQQHIHNKLINAAKEKLSTTRISISEIAYELGFEHPQSFNKLFKNKTNMTPLEFRASFN
jgi:AraC-like DNA-binding protein